MVCGGRAENHCSKTPLGDRWHVATRAQVEGADAQDVRWEMAMLHYKCQLEPAGGHRVHFLFICVSQTFPSNGEERAVERPPLGGGTVLGLEARLGSTGLGVSNHPAGSHGSQGVSALCLITETTRALYSL